MKKIVVIMLALTLAIPAVSFAGSATSRWDLTIGGDIKTDFAYSNIAAGELGLDAVPQRASQPGYDNLTNKYPTTVWGAGESTFNFAIRGPDAWGAKTSALLSGDFVGFWAGTATYNTFDLMNANMTFDWGQESLLLGQSISIFGMLPTFGLNIDWGSEGFGGKGLPPVAPGIWYTQKIGKNFRAMFQIQGPQGDTDGSNTNIGGNPANSQTEGPIPYLEASFVYESPACGKVGPWDLTIGGDFIYGKQKDTTGPNGAAIGATTTSITSQNVDEWGALLKTLVPIIPEHNGNRTGALYFDGDLYYGQNLSGGYYGSAGAPGGMVYQRPGTANFGSPVLWGYQIHGQYFVTDQFSFNGFWFHTNIKQSNWAAWATTPGGGGNSYTPGSVRATTGDLSSYYSYALNAMYDVNPAVRLVLSYSTTVANYQANSSSVGYENTGVRHVIHGAAYYFF